MGPWGAWHWLTVAWLVWIAAFVALETYALIVHPGYELTAHIRPVFVAHPLLWWLAAGLWVWLGWHFLAWRWELAVVEWLTGG